MEVQLPNGRNLHHKINLLQDHLRKWNPAWDATYSLKSKPVSNLVLVSQFLSHLTKELQCMS